MGLEKIKKIELAAKKDELARAQERYDIFIAGAYIDTEKPASDVINSEHIGKILRYKAWEYYDGLGHSVYMGEDVELRKLGEKHYGQLANAVAYERHYIKSNIQSLIVFPSGPGVFCELGDWATDKIICEKMLIIIDKKHEGVTNYINDGVVKAARIYRAQVEYLDYADHDKIIEVCNSFLELRASFARLDALYAR
ncbi:hypothetical protein AB9E29_04740 [Rhizobium leguminosarum]|uniref:hypothetical protein n=1 Tax=Rhizobium leguminosarum TaxID=384 RepID=UPI003F9C394D